MARKIEIDITGPAAGLVERLGQREGREPPAIVKRALEYYASIQDSYRGQTVIITDEKGKRKKLYVN